MQTADIGYGNMLRLQLEILHIVNTFSNNLTLWKKQVSLVALVTTLWNLLFSGVQ